MAEADSVTAAIHWAGTDPACEAPTAVFSAVDHTRCQLFVEFVRSMNRSGIPYCLLSGHESYPLVRDSDVDFMVRPDDAQRIGPLLQDVARRCGALLVQAIQHETSACYYILAKQVGGEVAYLHTDCTTDYRREERLWLQAEKVIENRRRSGTFFVPAIADEFHYYLVKKILKQQITDAGFQRIAALYVLRPRECCERLRCFWTKQATAELVSALVRNELGWMQLHLRDLLEELWRSVPVESRCRRGMQRLREWRRRASRAVRPTGLSIDVRGGSAAQRTELAAALERNLRPAFRRTTIPEGHSDGLRALASMLMSKVRSALIIRRTSATARYWTLRDEICFDLSYEGQPTFERATQIVLEAMANRLRQRTA